MAGLFSEAGLSTGNGGPGATAACLRLLIVFLGALVFNQIRGLDIHCGCFSTETVEGSAGLGSVLRDLSFLTVCLYLYIAVFFIRCRRDR